MMQASFRSLGKDLPTPEKNVAPERKPMTFMANQLAQSIEAMEKNAEIHRQLVANGLRHGSKSSLARNDFPQAVPATCTAMAMVQETGSPGQRSVYPSDDGSTSEKAKHCSTIHSQDESLTTEQLKAYKELEHAEMACDMKRMENCLTEERERSKSLQKMFATELCAQKDAHSRDVASLESMIGKVLAENQRLTNMVEGLCSKVEQGKAFPGLQSPTPSSTCPSGNTSSRSKHSPMQSGSSAGTRSEDDTPTSLDSRHKKSILNRVHTLSKKDRAVSPRPMSSEADHTTDSELIPSSDDGPQAPKHVWAPKPKVYKNID